MDNNPLSNVSLLNMFSLSVGGLFILLMVSFAVQKHFSLMSPICLFFLWCLLPEMISQKKYCYKKYLRLYWIHFPIVVLWFGVSHLSLIHFEFMLMCGVRRWPSSIFFCMYLFNFLNIIHWIDCLYSIVCSCLLCHILIDYKVVGLFLGSLFCYNYLCICFYASTMLFIFLWPCSTVWYQVAWFLQFCSSFSKLLWLFGVFCGSI